MDTQQPQNQNIALFQTDKFLYISGLALLLFVGLFTGLLGIWQYVVFGQKTEWLLRVLHSHGAWIGVIIILLASAKFILGEAHKKVYLAGASLIGVGATMGFFLYSLYSSYKWDFIETSIVRIHTHLIFYGVFLLLSLSLLKIINASEKVKKAIIVLYGIVLFGLLVGQSLFVFKGITPLFGAVFESAIFLAHLIVIYQLIKFLRKQLSGEEKVFGVFWLYSFVMIFLLTAVGVSMMLTMVAPHQILTEHGLYWYDKNVAGEGVFKAVEDLHLSPVSWFTSGVAISLGLLALRIPITFQVFALTLLAVAPTLNAIGRIAKILSTILPDAGYQIFGNGIKFGIAVLWLGGQPLKVFIVSTVLIYAIWWIRKSRITN